MALLSDEEIAEFKMSISSKTVESLQKMFNELEGQSRDATLSDHARGKAAEKAAFVKNYIPIREHGLFRG